MMLTESLESDLWNGEKAICFFVHRHKCYWVIDDKYNFTLDAKPSYKAHLDKGDITKSQYIEACKDFRGGLLKLTEDNFLEYLMLGTVSSSDEMKKYVFSRRNYNTLFNNVESTLVYGDQISDEDYRLANEFNSKLPLFYINFDRKIFMHMDWDRMHEDTVPKDWMAKATDFSSLIPCAEEYWVLEGKNYWKLNYI